MSKEKREGIKFLWAVPEGERCVAMVQHKGVIILATQSALYVMGDEDLIAAYIKDANITSINAT